MLTHYINLGTLRKKLIANDIKSIVAREDRRADELTTTPGYGKLDEKQLRIKLEAINPEPQEIKQQIEDICGVPTELAHQRLKLFRLVLVSDRLILSAT